MNWELDYLPEVRKDLIRLDSSDRKKVLKVLDRVRTNPLPQAEGGYGKPLGNKDGTLLTGLLKVKMKKEGIRVVYKLIQTETAMLVLVIGARADEEVYREAEKRRKQYHL